MSKHKKERTLDIVNRGLAKRYRAEKRFRFYGLAAIAASLIFLSLLFISIGSKGYSALFQTFIKLDVFFDPEMLRQESLATANSTPSPPLSDTRLRVREFWALDINANPSPPLPEARLASNSIFWQNSRKNPSD